MIVRPSLKHAQGGRTVDGSPDSRVTFAVAFAQFRGLVPAQRDKMD